MASINLKLLVALGIPIAYLLVSSAQLRLSTRKAIA